MLAWAVDHDLAVAVRLAVALCWWWWQGVRLPGQYQLLSRGGRGGRAGQRRVVRRARLAGQGRAVLGRYAEGAGPLHRGPRALQGRGPSRLLADVLAARSIILLNMGQTGEGAEDGRRALAMARELGYPAGEAAALGRWAGPLSTSATMTRPYGLVRLQQQITAASPRSPGGQLLVISALIEAGDLAAAQGACAAALARCRDVGDV